MTYTEEHFRKDISTLFTKDRDIVIPQVMAALATSAIDGNEFLNVYASSLTDELLTHLYRVVAEPAFYVTVTAEQVQQYREKSVARFDELFVPTMLAGIDAQLAKATIGTEEHSKLLEKRKSHEALIEKMRTDLMLKTPEVPVPGYLMQPYALKYMDYFVRAVALAPDTFIPTILDFANRKATSAEVENKLRVLYEGVESVSSYHLLYAKVVSQGMGGGDPSEYTKILRARAVQNVQGRVTFESTNTPSR